MHYIVHPRRKLFMLVLAIALLGMPQSIRTIYAASGRTYYVSKTGNNANGTSWATAWNELDQIKWDVIQPGDTILLDGGSSEMVYTRSIVPTKSGTRDLPITLKLAAEPGRNGRVIIFGGRSTPLPECGQASYVYQTSGVRSVGIELADRAWIVVDGTRWRGITIYGHNKYGISLSSKASNIVVRNVEIYDNGTAYQQGSVWNPDQKGVQLSGTNITFERAIIHDNGQDAFQSGGGVSNFTLRDSWLYNGRDHSKQAGYAFNYCRHPDGIQIYDGGVQSGVLIERSILGPGFNQGTILGQAPAAAGQNATINNVTLRDVLLMNATGTNIMGYPNVRSQNWRLERVTSFMTPKNPANDNHNTLYLQGAGHTIVDSIFYNGNVYLPDGNVSAQGNCQWQTTGNNQRLSAQTADPLFVSTVTGLANNTRPSAQMNLDFALRSNSACVDKGSRITSVAQLLGSNPPATTVPDATPPSQVTPQPSPTPQPLPSFNWEAEAGSISNPFVVQNGAIVQSVETTNPSQGGKAEYRFTLPQSGNYVVDVVLNAPGEASNSVFINIDGEPSNPGMIWDIPITNGFQKRTAAWRGQGTPAANEFAPKVFALSAGEHTLVIQGRERGCAIDKITLTPASRVAGASQAVWLPTLAQ